MLFRSHGDDAHQVLPGRARARLRVGAVAIAGRRRGPDRAQRLLQGDEEATILPYHTTPHLINPNA